jgi:menaquinone-dependent protoporphyrinogen oxidase
MKLLVVYATTEGHTRNVAEFIAKIATAQNHIVDVCDSAMPIHLSKAGYDAVILGGSVHQGQHQMSLRNFVFENLATLNELPCAFFSVSLSAAINEVMYQQEAQSYVSSFFADVGWQPLETACFAGALKYSEYDYFKLMVLKMLTGQLAPGTLKAQDTVYTNWEDVQSFTEAFLERVSNSVPEHGTYYTVG